MENRTNKRKALIGTIMFHALLLLCFIFMGLKYQTPPPPEEGITINFGFDDFGSGIEPPKQSEEQSETQNSITQEETIENIEDISSQNTEEVFVAKQEKKELNTTKEEIIEQVTEKPVVNTKALYSGKKNNNNTSQGISQGDGDQGKKDGDTNSKSYKGNGLGYDGIAFNLGGRTISQVKKPVYDSQAQGKVVVTIRVNKKGKVISANPGAKGSTTTNSVLYARAKEAALKTTFDSKADAPNVQIGTIIYHFKLY